MPTWTDIGGFWVSVCGFALAIALAIVGWVQAHRAKGDAKTAKEQANAAKMIAGEAKLQTAAAEAAAQAAQKQAAAAVAALDWETVPQLEVVSGFDYLSERDDGEVKRTILTSDWWVSNTGKAPAIRLKVSINLGTTARTVEAFSVDKLDGGKTSSLMPWGDAMPPFYQIRKEGFEPMAILTYTTPTGEERTVTKPVISYRGR